MFRPFIKVARPEDWTGKLAFILTWLGAIMLLIPVFLARLPATWVGLVGGYPIVIRVALTIGVLWLAMHVRAWLYARIPAAPYLVWNTVVFADRGQQRRVKLEKLGDVFVELRPPGLTQAFMVELADGSAHELCPVSWPGAGELYAALSKRLRRRQARLDRADRREARRARKRRA